MGFIKEESEDVKIEEAFRVKHEDTEEQTALMVLKEESQALNEVEQKDQDEKHDFKTGEKLIQTKKTSFRKRANRCFTCPQCGNCFNHKRKFKAHMTIHTGEKPFTVQLSGKSFTQNIFLKKRMPVHNGEKPFTCQECGKSLTSKLKLRNHMRIHTGEKPYTCCQCGKRFSHKIFLQSHMRIHTREKPFPCFQCDRRFMYKKDLKLHSKTHSGTGLPRGLEITESL